MATKAELGALSLLGITYLYEEENGFVGLLLGLLVFVLVGLSSGKLSVSFYLIFSFFSARLQPHR